MQRHLTSFIFYIVFGFLGSCSSTKNIEGRYATNFASLGFFGTTINLKQNGVLDYTFGGDMIHHYVTGHYRVYDNKVFMTFDKEVLDSNLATHPLFTDTLYKRVYQNDTIAYQDFCYIGHGKLFFADKLTGKKVNKATRYCKRKKYLFFGGHYYKKMWYLKKRDR